MQYMLLIYENETEMQKISPAEMETIIKEYFAFTDDIVKSGQFKAGDPLESITTATTVRVREGKTLTTDGPFAETKEVLGGFYLINASDLDEALKWAQQIPGAWHGRVEVRPVMEFDENGNVVG